MTLKEEYAKVKIKNKEFLMDDVLKSNMEQLKKSVEAKWDCVFVIDGREGVAKSTLGKMLGYYLSKGNFSVDNIVFTAEQFMEAVDKAKPQTAIVFDEMVMAGLSTDVLSSMQKALTKKFTLIRKKQLFIIMIIPYLFMLQKYFALSRALFLIHCYTPDGFKRGYFKFYNYEQKNFLYMVGHKYWNYNPKAKLSFTGKFPDYTGMFIDEEAYELKKDDAIKNINAKDEKEIKPTKKEWLNVYKLIDIAASKILGPDSVEYKHNNNLKRKIEDKFPEELKKNYNNIDSLIKEVNLT